MDVRDSTADPNISQGNNFSDHQNDESFETFQADALYSQIPALLITEKIQLYCYFIIVPLGFVLNCLCTVIFYKTKAYKTPTGLHITCISVTDNIALLGIFVTSVGIHVDETFPDILITNKYVCKLVYGVATFGLNISSLLLTSATIERCISVSFPLKIKSVNMLFFTKICITLYFIVSLVFGGLWYYSITYIKIFDEIVCTLNFEIYNLQWFAVLQNIIYYGFANGVSSAICLFCTTVIAFHLYKAKRHRLALTNENTITQNSKEFRISLMLFIIATIFVTSKTIELIIDRTLAYHWERNLVTQLYKNVAAAYPISLLLLAINHSVNFLIYLGFLKDFRKCCLLLFQRKTRRDYVADPSTNVSMISSGV